MSSKVKRILVLAVAATMLATYGCSKPSNPADDKTAKVEDTKTEDTKTEDKKMLQLLVKMQDLKNSQLVMNKNQVL